MYCNWLHQQSTVLIIHLANGTNSRYSQVLHRCHIYSSAYNNCCLPHIGMLIIVYTNSILSHTQTAVSQHSDSYKNDSYTNDSYQSDRYLPLLVRFDLGYH
jgi:hypothetical protein